jgi:hypothetical protein
LTCSNENSTMYANIFNSTFTGNTAIYGPGEDYKQLHLILHIL